MGRCINLFQAPLAAIYGNQFSGTPDILPTDFEEYVKVISRAEVMVFRFRACGGTGVKWGMGKPPWVYVHPKREE